MDIYQDVTLEAEVLKLIDMSIKYYNSSYIQARALLIANHSLQKRRILFHNIF